MISQLLNNWAALDSVALNGIGEYIEHARKIFPKEGEDLSDEKIEEILKTYTHILVCAHVLLLNCDSKYRSRVERDNHQSKGKSSDDGDLL